MPRFLRGVTKSKKRRLSSTRSKKPGTPRKMRPSYIFIRQDRGDRKQRTIYLPAMAVLGDDYEHFQRFISHVIPSDARDLSKTERVTRRCEILRIRSGWPRLLIDACYL